MTNLFKLRSKLFWPAVAVCLLPFVILSFLNSMAMDDYFFYDLYRTKGFWGAQHDLYLTWTGRYTSSFITGIFVIFDLPGRFPFLPTLLYFGFTWGAVCYLLGSFRPLLPAGFLSRGDLWKAAAILFVLFLYVQADIATGFFWLSSTTVYQTAFILFLLLIGAIVRRMTAPKPGALLDLLLYLLIVLLAGCNEIIAVFLPFFLAALAALFIFYGRRVDRWLCLGLAIALGMGSIIVFTSGVITYRHHLMNTGTGFLTVIPIIGFKVIAVFFYVFKEPLFWGCLTAFFILGIAVSPQLKDRLTFFRDKNVSFPGAIALLLIVIGSLAAFLLASRGSMPPRVLNDLSDMTACCLLALSFLGGIHQGAKSPLSAAPQLSPMLRMALLACLLLANINYAEGWKSVASGYFYHAVVRDRDRLLRTARDEHRTIAVIPAYDTELKKKIHMAFPNGIPQTAHDLFLQKPALLVFYDGAALGDAAYAHFYGLDSIIVGDK